MILGMTTSITDSIRQACNIAGGVTSLAAIIDVKPPTISQWLNGTRQIPAERCPEIEKATNGAVRCESLRPDVDWSVLRESKAVA